MLQVQKKSLIFIKLSKIKIKQLKTSSVMAINLDAIKQKLQAMQQASNGGGGNKAMKINSGLNIIGSSFKNDFGRLDFSKIKV